MRWTFRKGAVNIEKHYKRIHKTTPLIESPLIGADNGMFVFSQRLESNSVELFFDLFFVIGAASLTVFTAYHAIADANYLLAYLVFFSLLWATWFQVTLHDVRFARDSLYERVCKAIQLIVFFGIALVGSSFNVADDRSNNQNFEVLCYIFMISRGLMTFQHIIILYYVWRVKYSKLYLPASLMTLTFVASTGAFAGIVRFYRPAVKAPTKLYTAWCSIMAAEAVIVLTISCSWRQFSFKKTHLEERLSLLTMIVMGEGAIGVARSLGAIVRNGGLNLEVGLFIMFIILLLIFIWALYFDSLPYGHFGTIKQQIWSILHFPFHLATLSVIEGSQQIAMARYILQRVSKSSAELHKLCLENLHTKKLRDALILFVDHYSFKSRIETYEYHEVVINRIEAIGNSSSICSPQNAIAYSNAQSWPDEFRFISNALQNAIYAELGIKMPIKDLNKFVEPLEIAESSWRLSYLYFWSCFCAFVLSLIAFLLLIRLHRADLYDVVSAVVRCLVLGAAVGALTMIGDRERLYSLLNSVALLPCAIGLLCVIVLCDHLLSYWCNRRLVSSGEPYMLELDERQDPANAHQDTSGYNGSHRRGNILDSRDDSYDETRLSPLQSSSSLPTTRST